MRRLLATALTAALCAACGSSKSTGGCADPLMIDDMEDGDRFICNAGGRHGEWFVRDDGTSTSISPRGEFTQSLIPGGRGTSRYAAHMTGFGFTDSGAAMGFALVGDAATAQLYDASATGGIKFSMKSNVAVGVAFLIPDTIPAQRASGACVDDAMIWNCDNPFMFVIPPSREWTEYEIPYAALAQQSIFGPQGSRKGSASWNPSQLVNIEFGVYPGQTFDVWVDDVRFYSCAANECVPTCTDAALPVPCPATGTAPATCLPAGTICGQPLTVSLTGVWGFSPDDVWAGGNRVFLHWNGSAWSLVPSGIAGTLSIRWGSAPDDLWAVGPGGGIAHWNGSTWSSITSGTDSDIFGVWGSGRDDVWATGGAGTILHWDGASWSPVPSGTTARLWRAWGSGRDDVWAVGITETNALGVILHWNGSTWSPVTDDVPPVMGVWGSGSDDVWAVGFDGRIVHWNGTAWSAVPSGTSKQLLTVGGSGPDDVWAGGVEGTLLHWDGVAWTTWTVPSSSALNLIGVWARTASDAWIVGAGGTILHWDGTAWSLVPVEVQ